MKSKRNTLSFADRVPIYELLKEHYKKQDNGFWKYDSGWSDERIARKFGPTVSEMSVKKMRTQLFGVMMDFSETRFGAKLVADKVAGKIADLEARLARTESILERIMNDLGYKDAAQ